MSLEVYNEKQIVKRRDKIKINFKDSLTFVEQKIKP